MHTHYPLITLEENLHLYNERLVGKLYPEMLYPGAIYFSNSLIELPSYPFNWQIVDTVMDMDNFLGAFHISFYSVAEVSNKNGFCGITEGSKVWVFLLTHHDYGTQTGCIFVENNFLQSEFSYPQRLSTEQEGIDEWEYQYTPDIDLRKQQNTCVNVDFSNFAIF
mmetsp:Transcript_16978/g.28926  ORF Transcript_16978/g.28926 Transcript_16978/m.28926 type:complete len:165 (-) Transcript_16978:69-563(-)